MLVEVELEDLEKIIFATGVIKQIEMALDAYHRDPFVQSSLDYTKAHKNLTTAMQAVKRKTAGTLINWDGVLDDDDEVELLKQLMVERIIEIDGLKRAPVPGQSMTVYDTLAAKGCVRIGQCIKGAVWSGDNKPDFKPTANYAIAITPRGEQKVLELRAQGK